MASVGAATFNRPGHDCVSQKVYILGYVFACRCLGLLFIYLMHIKESYALLIEILGFSARNQLHAYLFQFLEIFSHFFVFGILQNIYFKYYMPCMLIWRSLI